MVRLAPLPFRVVEKKLLKLGYEIGRQRGSHVRFHHPNQASITVPKHRTIGRGILRKIIRDLRISVKEFTKL